MLMPGIIVNWLRGRYKNEKRSLLLAATRDWQAWLISMPLIIPVAIFLLNTRNSEKPKLTEYETATSVKLRALSRIKEMHDSKIKTPEIPRAIPVAEVPHLNEPILKSFTGISRPVDSHIVIGIATHDTLNVRSGPSANNDVIDKLPNGYSGIHITGAPVINGNNEWVPIKFENKSGWVSKQYLKCNSDE